MHIHKVSIFSFSLQAPLSCSKPRALLHSHAMSCTFKGGVMVPRYPGYGPRCPPVAPGATCPMSGSDGGRTTTAHPGHQTNAVQQRGETSGIKNCTWTPLVLVAPY